MSAISMKNIAQAGQRYLEDEQKIIYLTSSEPLKYDTNKWVYKTLPTLEQWHQDMAQQFKLHKQQSSNHLAFTFPENESLNQTWLSEIKNEGFQLGVLELYIIEGTELARFKQRPDITIRRVDDNNIEDYLTIYHSFALPYGEDFANESVNSTRKTILNKEDAVSRCVAYLEGKAVGTVDVIETDETVEIDSFGVLEGYQRQGIGTTIQSYIGEIAGERPVILVADGEDTAKDMYIKQGYTYQSFIYHIVKENVE
ncbi:acetyltransferase [Staphylococcus petrasii]|uniref:Acetyltransferase n=1 Tax=Staphylococcus petrasii TaxID=1276936 RepID=A0A380FYK0_9STAP|nr:GNAT family N-acetyltransferase [Staphylococcus petrasii]PNZ25385.1 GNAT family N-acetyltransferase [Staphylococcus petrasii]TGE12014.1 N-acetyltransferase [Staphylococcus petrasii]TGE19104.1 N-acetyltransferase [Staphylococcus petrasii]SUM43210.1 acetyltransferase [Staphylococcus petrasii]